MPSGIEFKEKDGAVLQDKQKTEFFGCCSRYRQCSDIGKCLIGNEKRSDGCIYRKKLESGECYYGKNADRFNRKAYVEILDRISKLSVEVKTALDNLIIVFEEYQRGTSYCISRNQYTDEIAATGMFEFEANGSEFVSMCAYKTFLQPAFKDIFKENSREKLTQENLKLWLNGKGRNIRDMTAGRYCRASKKADAALYIDEYYSDFLSSGQSARIYSLSPFAEDGLLSLAEIKAEEIRRIKLSHGYSEREKEVLNAEIDEKTAALMDKGAKAAEAIRLSLEDPFRGKTFVITGVLKSMERKEALDAITARGGWTADTPVSRMNCLVLGYQEWSEKNEGIASRKVQKAVELQEQGKNVKIISEDEFLDMLHKPPLKIE